jgi:hypothetical protein
MDVAVPTTCEVVRRALRKKARFPQNVFVEDWHDFFFFDSDWMTGANFVQDLKHFLEIENGDRACLLRLDRFRSDELHSLVVTLDTPPDAYQTLLAGSTPGQGWCDAMERLACASNIGSWCFYAEPNNEVAVVGFRKPSTASIYSPALARFGAVPFEKAVAPTPISYGFSGRAMSDEWRRIYLREYGERSSQS